MYKTVEFYFFNSLLALAFFSVVFITLALAFPNKKSQPLLRRDILTDLGFYFFLTPVYVPIQAFLQAFVFAGAYTALGALVFSGAETHFLSNLPMWLQCLLVLVLTDFLQYWTHRLSHSRQLWKFHAIHHSSKHVDWLSASRWHPVNVLFHVTLTQAVVWSLGFSERAFPIVIIITSLNSMLVHANINWSYGPLRYVIASPVFHRWHHTTPLQGGEKNFAPFFSVFDLIFGTFYLPEGVPSDFGTPYDDVPDHFFGQLWYPFRKRPPKDI